MRLKIHIIFAWFLAICASAYAISPPLGMAQGDAIAGVASNNLLFMHKNAANLVNMPSYLLGFYSLGAREENSSGKYDTPAGALLGLKLGAFSLAAHGAKSIDNNKINFLNLGAGVAYSLTPNLSLGIYGGYYKLSAEQYLDTNIGLLYTLRYKHEFIAGFGIYDFAFAVSALTNAFRLNNLAVKYQTVPGVSLQFFRSRHINFFLHSALGLDEGFTNFNISTSVTLQAFKYVKLRGGSSGDNIFAFNNYFASSSLNIPYKNFSFNLYASYEQKKYTRFVAFDTAEYGAGFYVDYAPPLVRLKQDDSDVVAFLKPEKVFSPNGDGHDDFMTIVLTHTEATHVRDYSFAVLDQNGQVVTIKRADLAAINRKGLFAFPNKFIWNGLDFRDQRVAEGNYNFRLVAVLEDGQRKIWNLGQIRLDKQKPTFNIYVKNKNYLLGSEKEFTFFIEDQLEDTVYYHVKAVSSSNKVVFEKKLYGAQSKFSWNGKIREFTYVDSGTYNFTVAAIDKAGNKRFRRIEDVQFYDEKSSVSLNLKYDIFSPNGDGRRDELPIQLLASDKANVASWHIKIISADKREEVRSFKGQVVLPEKVIWRGLNNKNKKVKDGVYHLIFSVLGKDGTYRHSLSYRVSLDSRPPILTISSDQDNFTPDADGIDDYFSAAIKVKNQTDIIAYKIKIREKKGKVIFEQAAKDNLPHRFAWDGVLTSGFSVDSFEKYSLEIEAMDAAGNLGKSNVLNFETGLIVRRMSDKVSLGEKFLLLRFPNISFARRTVRLDEKSLARVKRLAIYLLRNKQFDIEVIGHTDSRGSTKYNQDLSTKRARYIRSLLVKAGIEPDRIKAIGRGEKELLYKEINDAFRTRNRRFEIKLRQKAKKPVEKETLPKK